MFTIVGKAKRGSALDC